MAIQRFDEVNKLYKVKAFNWYNKMAIPEDEIKRRVDLALDYCEIMIMLFMLIEENNSPRKCTEFIEERIKVVAERYVGKDNVAYINDFSKKEAKKIVDLTYKHIEEEIEDEEEEQDNKFVEIPEFGIRVPEQEYWTSDERGLLVGVECATITANFDDLSRAMDAGKTRKTWVTEADDRVRPTHQEVNGQELPINEYFLVGNSYMLFPGDISRDAEDKEICNCRCYCAYF